MKALVITFLIGIAPFVSVVFLSYAIGRGDGRRAEQQRRSLAAAGMLASKQRTCIRL